MGSFVLLCSMFFIGLALTDGRFIGWTLSTGQTMLPGDCLHSDDGTHRACFQQDSNFVIYNAQNQPIWETDTTKRRGARLVLEPDNSIVMYNATSGGAVIWSSGSVNLGSIPSELVMQDDGDLVLVGWDKQPIWSSKRGTLEVSKNLKRSILKNGESMPLENRDGESNGCLLSPSSQYKACVEEWGFCIRNATGHVVWSASMHCNYIYYEDPQSIHGTCLKARYSCRSNIIKTWSTDTCSHGTGPSRLFMQDDGYLVIFGADARPIWSSKFGKTLLSDVGYFISEGSPFAKGVLAVSPNGDYQAWLHDDGTIKVWAASGALVTDHGTAIWHFGSNKYRFIEDIRLVVQGDKELVMKGKREEDGNMWLSSPEGKENDPWLLMMKDNGNLVLYEGKRPIWASKGFEEEGYKCQCKKNLMM